MRKWIATTVLALLALGACSGDDGGGGAQDTVAQGTATTVGASGAGTTAAGGSPGATAATTAPVGTVAAAPAGARAEFCDAHAQNRELEDLLAEMSSNPDRIPATLAAASASLDRSLEQAPAEVRADVQTFADAYRPVIRALQQSRNFLDIDPTVFKALSSEPVVTAVARIRQYFDQNCR